MSFFKSILIFIFAFVFLSSKAFCQELVVWEDTDKGIGLKRAAEVFTSLTGVKVKIIEFRYIYALERLRLDGPAGTGPDIFLLPSDLLGSAVAQGMISPVYYTPKERSIYLNKALEAASYRYENYMVPKCIETVAVFYNKKFLPKPLRTLQAYFDFSVESKKLDQYGLLAKFDDLYYAYPVLKPYGAYIFAKTGVPKGGNEFYYDTSDIGLNNKGAVEAIKLLKTFYDEDLFPSGIEGRGALNSVKDLFIKQKACAAILGTWDLADVLKSNLKVGITTLPFLPNGYKMRPFLGIRGYAISRWTNKYELALKFAKFATQDKYAVDRFNITYELPATTEALNEDAIRNNEYAKAFIVESHNAQLMPSDPATREVWIPYAEKLHEIYSGHVPVTLGLNEAVEEIKKNIEKQTSAPRLD